MLTYTLREVIIMFHTFCLAGMPEFVIRTYAENKDELEASISLAIGCKTFLYRWLERGLFFDKFNRGCATDDEGNYLHFLLPKSCSWLHSSLPEFAHTNNCHTEKCMTIFNREDDLQLDFAVHVRYPRVRPYDILEVYVPAKSDWAEYGTLHTLEDIKTAISMVEAYKGLYRIKKGINHTLVDRQRVPVINI